MDFVLNLDHTENDLVAALTRQDRWAQKVLYEQYYSRMMVVCLRYAGSSDEALDLLHEGFIKVFQNIGKYRTGTLSGWIHTIMLNNCIDNYRKSVRRRSEDLSEASYVSNDGPDALSKLSEKEILEAVQDLSPAYRTVFNLYVMEGYSHKEIADVLQINESTSRSNLLKARIKLQEHFTARKPEYETKMQTH
jgi:RNA polymerase sigma-70 factor (ECF subfamily)